MVYGIMITEIQIANYKSIKSLKLSLGRVNVFIGENGCGKSNILEAIALSSAAATDKLDHEFLASRGIRVTDPELMRSAFDESDMKREIKIYIEESNGQFFSCILHHDNTPYSKWIDKAGGKIILEKLALLDSQQKALNDSSIQISVDNLRALMTKRLEPINFHDFLIYSPENSSLHTFETSGQIEPIGINGEGLFKLLKVLDSSENKEKINQLKDKLQFIDWFDDFEIPHNVSMGERYIRVKDRYLDESSVYFDQRSSNEGFLFLLFYLALFISDGTPKFFGIDNIDASLNPKLCRGLVVKIVK